MIILYPIVLLVCALYYYATKNYNYWKKRNVPYIKPLPFFGNYAEYILFKKTGPQVAHEICEKFPNEPYVGVYYGTDPALIVKDPNIIKLVMTKDFYYFNQREISGHLHKEVITQNMFFSGGDRWKILRQNMTALFSSAKLKAMFYLIENCATNLDKLLNEEVKMTTTLEVKSLLARYTMDCIGTCAFGVHTGTLESHSKINPFAVIGDKIFDSSNYGGFRLVTRAMWPDIFYSLGFQLFPESISIFFKTLLTDVFKSRQNKASSRNDFVDLLLTWKTNKYLVGDSMSNIKSSQNDKKTTELEIDDTLLIGLCTLIFSAGYETTSSTTSYLLFELSKNQEAQTRVIEEVDDYFRRHDGKIEYECINEMPYLQACIEETERLYPVLGTLTREVSEEYTLPSGLCLEKGMRIHIPVNYLHYNSEYFPNPEEFRPERFFGNERKNVKQFTFMPFGEGPRICIEYILFKKTGAQVAQEICKKFPNEPYVGVYYGTDPALIVKDPNIIKLVMTKDFYYFNQRELSGHVHKEIITQNMFFSGGNRWKILRQNTTALFSSAKLKGMFYLIENCATSLDKLLNQEVKMTKTLEIKSLLARYTMDCIGSCAFGVHTGTLESHSKTNPFSIIGEKIFDSSNYGGFRLITRTMWPEIFYGLRFQLFPESISTFFLSLLTDVFKSRQYKASSRNDFVDLILTWKNKKYLVGDSMSNMKTSQNDKKVVELEIDDTLMISFCVLFFAAGFETTSITTSLLLFELSKNQEAQTRVIEEVDEYFQRHDGKIEFECINEMPYLQACMEESGRLYPVLGILTREVSEEYTLPSGLCLEKGMRIHIPVNYLHYNSEYFPNPEEFRPERFFGKERKNVKQFTYMPFGEGPRICIGLRFSKMPMIAGLLTIFRKYRVELSNNMATKVTFDPRSIVSNQPFGGIHLNFIPRQIN
ncbi:unnamed protein product, partial [Brenthis ino]